MQKNGRNTDNRTLVLSLKSGDAEAFKIVYKKYYSRLLHVGERYQLSYLTPNDFVQEAFIRLLNGKESLNEDVSLDSQLRIICKNILLNHLNREKKMDSVAEFSENIADDDFFLEEKTDVSSEKYQRVMEILAEMPKKRKEVFTLHKIERYSYEEIEKITGLSQKTIANHIYLAKEDIREKMNPKN